MPSLASNSTLDLTASSSLRIPSNLLVGLQVVMLVAPTTLAAAATQGKWDPTLVVVSVVQMILVAAATPALLAQVVAVRISPDAH